MAPVVRGHLPDNPLETRMQPTVNGGSLIIAERTAHLPGIQGRLNPILDNLDRIYLNADNVAINKRLQQPVHFSLNEPVRLTDFDGLQCEVMAPRIGRLIMRLRLPLQSLTTFPLSSTTRPECPSAEMGTRLRKPPTLPSRSHSESFGGSMPPRAATRSEASTNE